MLIIGSFAVALITTKPKFEKKHGRLLKILSRFGALFGFLLGIVTSVVPYLLVQPADALPEDNSPTSMQAELSGESTARTDTTTSVATTTATMRVWHPTTFSWDNSADYITFNSIRDNPNWQHWTDTGDERNFVAAKPVGNLTYDNFDVLMEPHTLSPDSIVVEDDKEYYVAVLVHNDMMTNLSNNVAEGVAARVLMSDGAMAAKEHSVRADIISTNAIYKKVDGSVVGGTTPMRNIWDDVIFTMDRDFTLSYVVGSARYFLRAYKGYGVYADYNDRRFTLDDNRLFDGGNTLGYLKNYTWDSVNGKAIGGTVVQGEIPSGWEYRGFIFFKVRVKIVS
jgi:hypothetical protein